MEGEVSVYEVEAMFLMEQDDGVDHCSEVVEVKTARAPRNQLPLSSTHSLRTSEMTLLNVCKCHSREAWCTSWWKRIEHTSANRIYGTSHGAQLRARSV